MGPIMASSTSPTLIQQLLIEPFSPTSCFYQLTASLHVSQVTFLRENQTGQVHEFKPEVACVESGAHHLWLVTGRRSGEGGYGLPVIAPLAGAAVGARNVFDLVGS